MYKNRAAGILLHPVSLPSRFCIGDLGPGAYEFIDYLRGTGARLWQILPLGPAGCGESPYDSPSAFAGNVFLVNPERLADKGLLTEEDLNSLPAGDSGRVDYEKVRSFRLPLLKKAARVFLNNGGSADFKRFTEENGWWLDDYVLFACSGDLNPEKAESSEVEVEKVLQYFFFMQWSDLKRYANGKGIRIIGDIPVFVSAGSADFQANPGMFHTDKEGRPSVVSGVPPDYFSPDGQLWGNPLYNWDVMKADGYSWWLKRIEHLSRMTDIIRIDHFRSFESYWEIPAGAKTAVGGRWVKAPGKDFFRAVRKRFPDLEILAEDLGVITEEVTALREEFGFPGMKVLQFAFEPDGDGRLNTSNQFLPFNYKENSVVYTGTHDNNTTRGWYNDLSEWGRDIVRRYLARPDHDIVWDLIREGMSSRAAYSIFPMQDLLDLGPEARMNLPSTVGENWSWKMRYSQLDPLASARFREMTELYGRAGK